MAGGKGTRLRPYTHILPKPLLPVGLKSILDINVKQLVAAGVTEIIIAVGYMGELIQSALGDGKQYGVKIIYSFEDHPLGTVGGIYLVKNKLKENFLVMNGDILHNIDFKKLFLKHISNKADVTITTYKETHNVRLGVLDFEGGKIKNYIEKPSNDYIVSIGVYVLNKKIIKNYVKPNEYIDFPTIINLSIKDNKLIIPFKHKGLWKDLGTTDEYLNIIENLEKFTLQYPDIPILVNQ